MRSIQIKLICFVLVLGLSTLAIGAEDSSPVTRIIAETSDGLQFSAWVDSVDFEAGRDVVVRYRVMNRGPVPIYLVRRISPQIANDEGTILIVVPSPGEPKYERFDFTFTKIQRKKSLSGEFTIPANLLRGQNEWPIRISFGYVTNTYAFDSGFSDFTKNELLSTRIQVLGIGKLIIKQR